MLCVGLTGNIGSGKSTIAGVWESLGARVIDADRIARDVLVPGSHALDKVLETFGKDVLDEGGELDRNKLAGRVFGDPEAVTSLNEIVHPPVIRRIQEIINSDPGKNTIYVVEAALIIESGRKKDYDVIVVVDSDLESCVERVMKARAMTREEVLRIAGSQMDREKKRSEADIIIDNSGSLDALRREAIHVYHKLIKIEEESRTR